jgi:hypothetical protein
VSVARHTWFARGCARPEAGLRDLGCVAGRCLQLAMNRVLPQLAGARPSGCAPAVFPKAVLARAVAARRCTASACCARQGKTQAVRRVHGKALTHAERKCRKLCLRVRFSAYQDLN